MSLIISDINDILLEFHFQMSKNIPGLVTYVKNYGGDSNIVVRVRDNKCLILANGSKSDPGYCLVINMEEDDPIDLRRKIVKASAYLTEFPFRGVSK